MRGRLTGYLVEHSLAALLVDELAVVIFQSDEQRGAVVGERFVFIPEGWRLDVFERGRWTCDVEHTTEVSRGAARGPTIARRPVTDGGVDGRVGPALGGVREHTRHARHEHLHGREPRDDLVTQTTL